MCGYGVTNKARLESSNAFCVRRGPDITTTKTVDSVYFLHNLLHITGEKTTQPFEKDGVVCVFNGEIYNYDKLGSYSSDGECLIDLYEREGEEFCKLLDGEFSICLIDFNKNILITSVDSFSCKPLWKSFDKEHFGVASYKSQLVGIGFKSVDKQYSNTTEIRSMKDFSLINTYFNVTYDLEQKKNSYDDWIQAFSNSIAKRTRNTNYKAFIGMSSGFDSGAIACELTKQGFAFKAYSIINNEDTKIIYERGSLLKEHESYLLSDAEYNHWSTVLNNDCEDFIYDDGVRNYNIKSDKASKGLASICHRANKEGRRIYFSGQGADEIISDYGHGGNKIYYHSEFGGLFPEKLEGFFPWHSFYDGTQIQYLNKEEYVAGHFGIETRYPFLDKDLVQEFLWLSPDLKNKEYKSCLAQYLRVNNFPYSRGEKRGFNVIGHNRPANIIN